VLRVVVDPNVFVSAVISPNGTSAAAIRAGFAGSYRIVACPALIDELAEVLTRSKLARYVSAEDAIAFVDAIVGAAEMHDDPAVRDRTLRDPDDEYLVALANEASADLIVSGDHDLLDASVTPAVVDPRRFLERLREQ
jgi:putative PIN family toxin of toxin-antitoxin system